MRPARGPLREVVYRLRRRPGVLPPQLPFRLVAAHPHLAVETRVAHLDDRGRVWRLLDVMGPPGAIGASKQLFLGYRGPHLLEREVLAESSGRLLLWYKYRPPRGREGFSHTAQAFQRLGRDTLLTDRTFEDALTITLLTRGASAIPAFLKEVEARSADLFTYEVLYVGPPRTAKTPPGLTSHEMEALRAAHAMGYFLVPRKASLADVARRLGVSASATGYRLRRAAAKLAAQVLG